MGVDIPMWGYAVIIILILLLAYYYYYYYYSVASGSAPTPLTPPSGGSEHMLPFHSKTGIPMIKPFGESEC